MMIRSMTGFGRHEVSSGQYVVSVELKSVNHRFLDISAKLPKQFLALEDILRKAITERLVRGHVDAFLSVRTVGMRPRAVHVDLDLAAGYLGAISRMSASLGLESDGSRLAEVLVRFPDVFRAEEVVEDLGELAELLRPVVLGALDELVRMRETEGQALADDLQARLGSILGSVRAIDDRAPVVVEDYRERLQERVAELLGEVQADASRLAVEVAIFADRSNITEELVRLASHTRQFQEILSGDGAVGRRLDFLVQEMFREVNTIGSKANDLEIATHVVTAKTELEKIREQVQNIE